MLEAAGDLEDEEEDKDKDKGKGKDRDKNDPLVEDADLARGFSRAQCTEGRRGVLPDAITTPDAAKVHKGVDGHPGAAGRVDRCDGRVEQRAEDTCVDGSTSSRARASVLS